MSALWLRQDPMLRTFPRWLLWSLATTLLLLGLAVSLGLYVEKTQGRASGDLLVATVFGFVLWLPAMLLLLSRASRSRCTPFDLALPLAVPRLWTRHLVATALSGGLLIASLGGIAALILYLLGFYTEETLPLRAGAFVRLGLNLACLFTLAATLVQSAAPERAILPASRRHHVSRLLLAMAVFGLAVLWSQLPLVTLVFPLLTTWPLVRWARKRLPATWGLDAAAAPGDAMTPALQGSWEEAPRRDVTWSGLGWQLFLLRTIHTGTPKATMTLWIGVPMLLGFGAILSGAFIHMGDEEIRWTMLAITIYMLFAIHAKPLAFLHGVDTLPLSRRHLFALLTVPSLLVLALGYGAGRLLVTWKGTDSIPGIWALQTCAGVGVPADFHRIAWDGEVEPIVAPWGESHAPFTAPLVEGWNPVVVSRFCTRDSNVSTEFEVFQTRLAAETLYGQAPSDEELRAFLAISDPSTPHSLAVPAPLRLPGERGVFPLLTAIVCMGTFGALALYLRTFRVGRLDRLRKGVFVGLLALLLAIHMAQFAAFALGLTSLWAWDVLWKTGTRSLVAALPGGTLTLWLMAGLAIGITYRLAERQFERAELPVSRDKTRC